MELLIKWRPLFFCKNADSEWRGTASDLMVELKMTESIASIVDRVAFSRNAMGTQLQTLIAQGTQWIAYRKSETQRLYIITRPEDVPVLN
jgi:hypothetical protein